MTIPPAIPAPTRYETSTRSRLMTYLFVLTGVVFCQSPHLHGYVKLPTPVPYGQLGTVVRANQLTGEGRVYLVQLGPHHAPYTVVELAAWLREKYSLDTQVLPALSSDSDTYDASRHRFVEERMIEQIKRSHPELATDPKAVLIGFSDEEMYSATEHQSNTFTLRDSQRVAVISASNMQALQSDQRSPVESSASQLTTGLRRILLKDVALLFWHLPLNNNPASVLYFDLDVDISGAELYQSDLDPLHSQWGEFVSDPCIVFTHTPGSAFAARTPLIQRCRTPESPRSAQTSLATSDPSPDTSQERVELRLAYGLLTEKHTDFYLPGPVPIRFERALTNQFQMPAAFGLSGSHNYDRYLVSHDDMLHITIANAGSGGVDLRRNPSGVSLLSVAKWVDTNTSGRALTLRWLTEPIGHFDLSRFNGEIESYLPCIDAELCYLYGYQDPAGQRLTLARDAERNLTSLSAPQNNWLRMSHDHPQSKIRITSIVDSQGRSVRYSYNINGQLSAVAYPSGETVGYTWDHSQNLLSVASTFADRPPVTLITNRYDRGHLTAQTLADGSTYTYVFLTGVSKASSLAQVTAPDGACYTLAFTGGGGAVMHTCQYKPDTSPSNDFHAYKSVHSVTARGGQSPSPSAFLEE